MLLSHLEQTVADAESERVEGNHPLLTVGLATWRTPLPRSLLPLGVPYHGETLEVA